MSSFFTHLSESELVQTNGNLKLSTTSSLKLSSSHQLFPSPLLSLKQLLHLVSTGAWVSKAHGLVFSFAIDTRSICLLPQERMDLMETLGVLLRDAKVWSELDLQAALTYPAQRLKYPGKDMFFSESKSGFVLRLSQAIHHGNSSDISQEPDTTAHTAYDVTPPLGVLHAYLEEILLDLKFSTRTHDGDPRGDARYASYPLKDALNPSTQVLYNGYTLPFLNRDLLRQPLPEWRALPRNTGDLVMLDTDVLPSETDEDHQSDYKQHKLGSTPKHSETRRPRLPKIASCTRWEEDASHAQRCLPNQKANVEDFYMLAEAYTRSMISGKRGLLAQGIASTSSASGPTLAELARPVFNTGFLSAFGKRKGYMRSIARSITAVHDRSMSSTFRSRVETMASLSLEEHLRILHDDPDFGSDGHSSSVMMSAVELRLWQMSQGILSQVKTAGPPRSALLGTEKGPAGIFSIRLPSSEHIPQHSIGLSPKENPRLTSLSEGFLEESDDVPDITQLYQSDILLDENLCSERDLHATNNYSPGNYPSCRLATLNSGTLDDHNHLAELDGFEPEGFEDGLDIGTSEDIFFDDVDGAFGDSLFVLGDLDIDEESTSLETMFAQLDEDNRSTRSPNLIHHLHEHCSGLYDCQLLDFEEDNVGYNGKEHISLHEVVLGQDHASRGMQLEENVMLSEDFGDKEARNWANGEVVLPV